MHDVRLIALQRAFAGGYRDEAGGDSGGHGGLRLCQIFTRKLLTCGWGAANSTDRL
jgi:hypothetical protein